MTKDVTIQELTSGKKHKISLPCVVGRGKEADVIFSDPTVSHRHALILEQANKLWIEDLNSSNGVYVNDKKIKEKARFRWGDTIQLGQTKLIVSQAEEDISEQTIVVHSLDPKAERNLDHERLELIYEITAELSENQDLNLLGEKIFSRFKKIFKQDRSYLALFREDGTLQPVGADSSSKSIPLSRSIVNRLFRTGESFLLADGLSDEVLREEESIIALRIRSALCAPLIYHNQIYGLIYLDRNIPGAYKQEDLEFFRAIALLLSPLIENARLWSELKSHYDNAMETLRKTQARLIDAERKVAYVRLAQAMAHEIRNPLMAIGGLVRRMGRSAQESSERDKYQAVMNLVQRVEAVLKDVDDFVKFRSPQMKLERVDHLIQEVIDEHNWDSLRDGLPPILSAKTSQLMIPLDSDLFKKAFSMIFQEIILGIPQGSEFKIYIQDSGNELEILIGEVGENRHLFETFDPELRGKPWSLGLFLNIAHKIISDHGGKLLLDSEGHTAFPLLVTIPRTISI